MIAALIMLAFIKSTAPPDQVAVITDHAVVIYKWRADTRKHEPSGWRVTDIDPEVRRHGNLYHIRIKNKRYRVKRVHDWRGYSE